jgi:hypothetical protein
VLMDRLSLLTVRFFLMSLILEMFLENMK